MSSEVPSPPSATALFLGARILLISLFCWSILKGLDALCRQTSTDRLVFESAGILWLFWLLMGATLLGQVAAGLPTDFADVDNEDVIELTCDIVPNRNDLYALKVQGNSMIDALIHDGDIVIMQHQTEAKNGEMVAARLIEQNETTLKRVYRENGHVRLQPANPNVKPLIVTPEAVESQGKVIAVIRQIA